MYKFQSKGGDVVQEIKRGGISARGKLNPK